MTEDNIPKFESVDGMTGEQAFASVFDKNLSQNQEQPEAQVVEIETELSQNTEN